MVLFSLWHVTFLLIENEALLRTLQLTIMKNLMIFKNKFVCLWLACRAVCRPSADLSWCSFARRNINIKFLCDVEGCGVDGKEQWREGWGGCLTSVLGGGGIMERCWQGQASYVWDTAINGLLTVGRRLRPPVITLCLTIKRLDNDSIGREELVTTGCPTPHD